MASVAAAAVRIITNAETKLNLVVTIKFIAEGVGWTFKLSNPA